MYFTDQLNRIIELASTPQRIVSLVPSQTELLFDLGMDETVVGITKFCVHPKEWHQSKTRVGGTKKVNIEKVISLKPDLIIANKEENLKSDIEALE
jgi:ABC-type Fe3+-hydroxamate transport system substrate-binding protein